MSDKAELIVENRTLSVSNLNKVLYPKAGFTKGQVIDYYIRIAPVLLPHLKDRPLTMKRYPDGVEGEFFYEKNCPTHRPKWVRTAKVWSEGNNRMMNYCLAQDLPTLVWAANLADLELHTSLCAKEEYRAPDHDGVRPRSGCAGRHRAVLSGRSLAARSACAHETQELCQDQRIERSADLRAAQYAR